MNARDLSSAAPAAAALPPSNPGLTSTLDLPAARSARDGLRSLLGAERNAATEFPLALSDFDARRGWEPLGYASLFDFLRGEFQLSRSGAFWRQSAARLLQRFPEVVEPLRDGRLCTTTAAEVAKVVTRENLADVLPRFFGLSSREAAEVTAALQPRPEPPTRTVVTELALKAPAAPIPQVRGIAREAATRTLGPVQALGLRPIPSPAVAPRTEVEPLSADARQPSPHLRTSQRPRRPASVRNESDLALRRPGVSEHGPTGSAAATRWWRATPAPGGRPRPGPAATRRRWRP